MNKTFFSRIFTNKIFLIVLSFVISFSIWVGINMDDTAQTSYVVSNIPITIDLPESADSQGLKVFNKDKLKGSVTVVGNRALIGNLSSDDIEIVPEQTDSLTSAGSYTLSLVAKKKSSSLNYTIESVSPGTVYIKLDRNRTITKKVENNIDYTIPKGYYGTVLLSDDEVSISGPETEIKKIDKVVIEDTIDEELTDSRKSKYDVKLLDAFGEELSATEGINITPSQVTATVSVLQMKYVDVGLSTSNGPSSSAISEFYSIEPDKISIAGESDTIKGITTVNTDELDFSTLRNKAYNINKDLEIPSKCIDINSVNSVNVKLDLSSMKKKKLTVSNFSIRGLDTSYDAVVTTSSIEVIVYGDKDELESIDSSDVTAYVDFNNTNVSSGYKETDVQLSLNGTEKSWIYGDYSVVVDISEV